MYYEINVSRNGQHFFATAERSIRTLAECEEIMEVFMNKFPEREGFKVIARLVETRMVKVEFPQE